MGKQSRYSAEVRERAVRLVKESEGDYGSERANTKPTGSRGATQHEVSVVG